MYLEEIPFNVWFYGARDKLTPELIGVLNPFSGRFFRYDKSYLQLDNHNETMLIITAVGKGKNWMDFISRQSKKDGFNKVAFYTADDNWTVQALAKYYKANKVNEFKDFYGNGKTAYFYEIDLNNSRLQ